MSNFLKAAAARNSANEAYKTAFRAEMRSLKPMTDSDFLATLDVLIECVVEARKGGRDVENAVDHFRAGLVFDLNWGCDAPDCFDDLSEPVRWELLARFVKRYEMIKATLSKHLWELKGLEKSDDSYGDFIDSLPLAGRAVQDGLFQEDIATYKQLEKALEDNPLKDFILSGENYIEMALERMLEKAFLSVARSMEDDEDEDRPRENPHCVVQMVPIKERDWGDTMGMQLNVRGPFRDHHEAEKFAKQEDHDGMVVKIFGGTVLR